MRGAAVAPAQLWWAVCARPDARACAHSAKDAARSFRDQLDAWEPATLLLTLQARPACTLALARACSYNNARAPTRSPQKALDATIRVGGARYHDCLELKSVPRVRCRCLRVLARASAHALTFSLCAPPAPACAYVCAHQALTQLALREDLPDGVRARAETLVHSWSFVVLMDADGSAAGAFLNAPPEPPAAPLSRSGSAAARGMGVSAAANTARVAPSRGGSASALYAERYMRQEHRNGAAEWAQ